MGIGRNQQPDKENLFFQRLMIFLAICLSIKYIFVDFGIDAEFQITMSYRFTRGDIMFREMWEPYQMSSFLCAFFIKIYTAVFHTTKGIVLFLQFLGVLLDGSISFLLYRIAKKYLCSGWTAFAMAWVFFLVSPKDVPLPEYANMQIWFSTLLCLTVFLYDKTKKRRFLLLSALCLCGEILAYPSCLILLPGIAFLFLYRRHAKGFLFFLGVCFGMGFLYLLWIFQKISVRDFPIYIKNILALETSHSTTFNDKCTAYLREFAEMALVFALAYLAAYGIVKMLLWGKKTSICRKKRILAQDILFFLFLLLIGTYTVIFWEYYVRLSYSVVFPAVILIGMRHADSLDRDTFYFYLAGTTISFFSFFATIILTNLELIASVPYLLLALVTAFLPIAETIRQIHPQSFLRKGFRIVTILTAIFLTMRNAYIIRPMNGDVSTVAHIRGIVKDGPAIGIISEYMGPYMQNESFREWKQYIPDGSRIYLIGGSLDTLGYLYADTEVSAPSVVPTPGYNESILEYWKINPDKYPDVVIASCW